MEKIDVTISNIESAIEKIKNKENKIVFLSPDTKGGARASVAYIYRQAMILQKSGYNVSILHEKNDYMKPGSWLGAEYDSLIHESIEDNKLTVGPQDYLVVPEIYGNIFEQIQQLPIDKILLIQSYEYLLEPFAPGKSWLDFEVTECITTSKTLANMVEELTGVPGVNYIAPGVSDAFKPATMPQKPLVAIHCRDQRKAAKVIKTFYLKYPLFRFISFKDMHGMTEVDFANNLRDCAVSVWIDDDSTFGTFPIESMLSNVPVIGKIPNIIPEWVTDDNGIWVYDENQIPDLIFNYMKNWLEDSLPENFTKVNETMVDKFTIETFEKATVDLYESLMDKKITKLVKIKETFEQTLKENEN
jgi:hypothetical protein